MRFEGRTVVVMGAAAGSGRGYAEAFAAKGASVVADVDAAGSAETVERTEKRGAAALAVRTDVSGEALVMEGSIPRGVFSNVVLWNRMGHTEDCRDRRVSLNAAQMELGPGRDFRIVVAHRDPGIRNRLETAGRQTGTIYWRHMLPESPPETARCSVVPFDDVAAVGV